MNTQEAYENIREYFMRPDAAFSLDEDESSCVYRSPEGRKCAVGSVIPDSEYQSLMDGNDGLGSTQAEALSKVLDAVPSLKDVDREFLLEAQQAHDTCSFRTDSPVDPMEVFLGKLDSIAGAYGLKVA